MILPSSGACSDAVSVLTLHPQVGSTLTRLTHTCIYTSLLALAQLEDAGELGDEADSPIIVPRPGQILRRTARTKIRKPGQTAEGPHRFSSARARRGSGRTVSNDGHTPSDRSSSDHGDSDMGRRSGDSDVPDMPPLPNRPDSYSEESSIYDAYVREEPEDEPVPDTAIPDFGVEFSPVQFDPTFTQPHGSSQHVEPEPAPVLHHPQPQRVLSPPIDEGPARSPSPESTTSQPEILSPRPSLPDAPSYQPPPSPSPSESSRRDKDKKGLFGKWGGDKGGKKGGKESKEKDSGFFGSLFGGNKKSKEETAPPPGGLGNNGRETAAALLGASKSSKSSNPSPSPQPIQGYARYPIHVERAIYRLSHIKLANPRRPLYEQVLISNLMFWYLGVINKTGPSSPAPGNANGTQNPNAEKEQAEKEKKEKKEREERERLEKERAEKEKAEKRESSRKGSLTKTPAPGSPGGRRAEMAVRGPQYDMQHRAMEQEYGNYGQSGNPPMGRTASAPAGSPNYQQSRSSGAPPGPYQPQQSYSVGQIVQPQPQAAQGRHYNGTAPSLPPGAMPPVNVEAGGAWHSSPGSAPAGNPRSHTSPSPPPRGVSPPTSAPLPSNPGPRRAKSPPSRYGGIQEKQHSGGGRMPSRSLSANATPTTPPVPQVPNGIKKGNTFHAVTSRQASEEEDLPLAYYQQQQRRKP